MVERTKPSKLRVFAESELRDCEDYFLGIQSDSTLPPNEIITASERLTLIHSEIDRRHSDARHAQTQRLARWAIGIGILGIFSAIVAIVFGIANRPTPQHVPTAATEAAQTPAVILPTPAALATTTPTSAALLTTTPTPEGLTVLPTEDVARVEQAHQEAGTKEKFPLSNSPTIGQPSITPAPQPWLFPDSSSRYLSATDVSSLSSADLWRARNEIFARKGYKFSSPRGIAFSKTLGSYYRGVDENQDRVYNKMNQYERANLTLIRAIERGR
jgi:hypothetical protein